MRRTYHCPHCRGHLNPNVKIVLRAEFEGVKGLMLFSPQPGNYDAIVPNSFKLRKGGIVRFSCPICGKDLTSRRDQGWAEVAYENTSGDGGQVAFSRAFGHHATYFITDEQVRPYGEDAMSQAPNFWGVARGR